jgi:hypothetical protein
MKTGNIYTMKANGVETEYTADQAWQETVNRLKKAASDFVLRKSLEKQAPENQNVAQSREFSIPQPKAPKMNEKSIPQVPEISKASQPKPLSAFMKAVRAKNSLGSK